jgi:mannose-6-phosphate isomerase-like protein (cupin superfamily)
MGLANACFHGTLALPIRARAEAMKINPTELLSKLPAANGEHFIQAFAHGTMSVEMYSPIGTDPQQPHSQDELYFIHSGSGTFVRAGESIPFAAGDCLFVAANVPHRFEAFTPDFSTWVVFWGPQGGEV